jgi:hypothetical protein
MNRPTNTALKIAGSVLALSALGGALTGCSGSDSGGGSDDAAPKAVTLAGFCEKLNGIGSVVGKDDTAEAVAALRGWVADMDDYGVPEELSGDARDGFGYLMTAFKGVDKDATIEDLQKLGTDVPPAEQKKVTAFTTWSAESCKPSAKPTPSDDAS